MTHYKNESKPCHGILILPLKVLRLKWFIDLHEKEILGPFKTTNLLRGTVLMDTL